MIPLNSAEPMPYTNMSDFWERSHEIRRWRDALRPPRNAHERCPQDVLMSYTPLALKLLCQNEPQHGIQNTYKMLEDYEPMTRGMKKAKSFWLKTEKYEANPAERERIREAFFDEVVEMHDMLLEKHACVSSQSWITRGFHRKQIVREPMPAEFTSLHYYCQLEPDDLGGEELISFLGPKASGERWYFQSFDFRTIEQDFPEKIDMLKDLLWLRHLSCKHEREGRLPDPYPEATLEMNRGKRICFYMIMAVSSIATIAMTALTIALAQPLILIPALLSAVVVVMTPILYPYY